MTAPSRPRVGRLGHYLEEINVRARIEYLEVAQYEPKHRGSRVASRRAQDP